MDTGQRGRLAVVLRDLTVIFGPRLESVAAYGRQSQAPAACLAIVRALSADDLAACAARATAWRRDGAATPLVLTRDELTRSLDAFPIEYSEIAETAVVLHGDDPFAGLTIHAEDVRRACEVQVKSHLLHLRENYIEAGGRQHAVTDLVRESAPAFATLLRRLARLDAASADTNADLDTWATRRAGLDPRIVGDVLALTGDGSAAGVDAARLFPGYLHAVEALARFIDQWRQ